MSPRPRSLASRLRLTQRRKRTILGAVEPLLKLGWAGWGVLSGDRRRRCRREDLPHDGLKILVVRLDTIGDVLLSEPALRAIRARFPRSEIHLITSPAGAAVVEGTAAVDRIIAFRAPWHAAWRGQRVGVRDVLATAQMIRALRAERYDLGIELRADFRDIAFLAVTGARVTVGDSWRGGGWLLTVDARAPVEAHRVEFALAIAAAAGADPTPSRPQIVLSESDRAAAARALAPLAGRRFVAFHLGAGFASKCLPVEHFAKVAGKLGRERAVVVIGGADERPLVEQFRRLAPVPVLDLVGRLSLKETAALLERADLFVGNDSGPMHLAAAVGRPIVTFFGPSEPHKYRPYGVVQRLLEIDLPCRPCDHVHCVHEEFFCMTRIAPSEIVEAAEELLAEAADRFPLRSGPSVR
ncbi:MAG: glycosyltransferase family 9 protein [Chloroflexota bacterium]|nr:glycosyltransferase family 9 protein [Dehalococcoidia bacterium]MDW8252479.1 glycosyltransferase family 9 protein [Chloroflexota bacterium]